ncbi:MAG: DUF262 domain-containing protein, partial [Clostridia bacterium]|nr:DUF262 domain-containing protein [Clostridia bacterium]
MPYQTIKIIDIVNYIHSRKILLPAIQRKFVWSDQQIIKLMDSIMQKYPIGTFLFWKVKEATINRQGYSMYDFIDNYHERDKYTNEKISTSLGSDEEKTIWAVLDGQQRLTALYIALHGSVSRKLPKKWWNNDDAFPKKELYFNLHSKYSEEDETSYEFKFLTKEEAEDRNDDKLWYHVKDILQFKREDLIPRVVAPLNLMQDMLATANIYNLHDQLVENDKIISYFEVEKESIDDVLDIFVRINSGGTVLSKSDLLFSTIVSHWDNARDEIDKLLAGLNRKGQTFSFSTDFVIRCCLYLLDLPVKLKVETFKKESVQKIKNYWNNICEAIRKTIDLLVKFGFNRTNIMSDVAITPIAYYIYNNGKLDNDSISELKKYFIAAQVKQIFSASTNSALANIRTRLQNASFSSFKLYSLRDIKFTGGKTLN